ncbi:MAG: filamentous hemagglutinin N-terminal domain-containing protein [Sulfuritalea sp.]|nr:filamentous hemagglutinin N-terminal domain-containing protein [Sulfuritalea sp.]
MFKHASLNRAYRLVWSELHHTWVAVSEFARSHGKRGASVVAAGMLTLGANAVAAEPVPTALPTGGAVTAGQVAISSSGARMDLNQSSSAAIVNWDSFNIGSQAHVNFNQPSASSVILNRVMGGDGSAIFGRMTANGNVFVTDPGGILFAPGAQVNVGGLVASSLGISDTNFLAGKYQFEKVGAGGTVINQGTLNAANGGFVALIAPQVSNSGAITATAGSVGLAAGDSVNLDFDHDGMLSFQVDVAAAAARTDNSGVIIADGGRVVMNAQAKDALLSTVLNNDGVIRARSLESRNGEIWLGGGNSGVVNVTGTLDASGAATGQTGGSVKVLGDKVGLFGQANIDVSGVGAGGTALVGGNFQGKGPEQNASMTYVGKDVKINADAVEAGNGGKVIVWADGSTRFHGAISARSGAQFGDGGMAEVSGKRYLDFRGAVDLTAGPGGRIGTLLLDPDSITIQAASPDIDGAISGATNDITALTDLDDHATDFAGAASVITSGAVEGLLNGASLKLDALNFITVNSAITQANSGTLTLESATININANIALNSGTGALVVQGDGGAAATAININTATITTGAAGASQTYTGPVTLGTALTLNSNGGNILFSSTLAGGNQDLTIAAGTAAGTTTFTGAVSGMGDGTGAAITLASTGAVRFMNTVGGASGIVSSNAGGSTRFDDNVTLTDGDTASSFAGTANFDGLNWSGFDGLTVTGAATLSTGAVSLDSNGGNILFSSSIDGGVSLTLTGGAGSISVTGATGNTAALSSFTVTGSAISLGNIGGAAAGVTGNVLLNGTGAVSLGASKITGYLDVTAGGDITQTGILTIGGNLWAMSSGNIYLKSLNVLSGTSSLIAGSGKEAWLNATRIEVGKVRPSDSTTTNVGIKAANVTLEAPSGSAFITAAGTSGGLVTATAPLSSTAALTIRTLPGNGVIGNVAFPVSQGLNVNTSGLVKVFGDAVGTGTIHLVGDDAVQPKYEFSGNPLYRSVKYNGAEATNAQLTGALDAAYLDIRNQTTEIRESGFAKENANKVLRRGVVTSAGPGQPAIDDSTGLASAELCDGGFSGGQLACQ